MTIEQQVSQDFLEAFKARKTEVKTILGVVKSDFDNIKKNLKVSELSDKEAITILTKFSKNLKENIKLANDDKSKFELEVISKYLPKQMSLEEVEAKVSELISNGLNTMPLIMKEFAALSADKKMVSDVVKARLS
jgi:uncharacterized protein YqeY